MNQWFLLNGFLLVLGESHTMCFDYIPLLQRIHPLSLPTQLCVLLVFFINLSSWIVQPIYSWTCGLPLECGWLTRGYALRENWLFRSQNRSIADNSSARDGTWCRLPLTQAALFCLFLSGVWTGLVRAVITAASSPMWTLRCVLKRRFPL